MPSSGVSNQLKALRMRHRITKFENVFGSGPCSRSNPDWVPAMDTGQRIVRITLKTMGVYWFDHRANWPAKVRNVSSVGSHKLSQFFCSPSSVNDWRRSPRAFIATKTEYFLCASQPINCFIRRRTSPAAVFERPNPHRSVRRSHTIKSNVSQFSVLPTGSALECMTSILAERFTHGIIRCGFYTLEPPPEHSGFPPGSSFFYSTERRRATAAAICGRTSRL